MEEDEWTLCVCMHIWLFTNYTIYDTPPAKKCVRLEGGNNFMVSHELNTFITRFIFYVERVIVKIFGKLNYLKAFFK